MKIDRQKISEIVKLALREDVGAGDITTAGFVPESKKTRGEFIACEPCVVAGIPVVQAVFEELDTLVKVIPRIKDGSHASADSVIAEISGPARPILTGERVALNFLQRLSGIATLTAQFVEKVKGHDVEIKDTRKTTPGLRYLEKYAVSAGGGTSHRMGLYDAVLVKDNHLKLISGENPKKSGDISRIVGPVKRFRESNPGIQIEIEAETVEEVRIALSAGADVIMLDNMSIENMKKAVELIGTKATVEASGGMTLDGIAEVAATGVDWISVGALTSSAPAIDIKLELGQ